MRHARFAAQATACAEMFHPMEVLTIYVTTHEARTFAPFCAKLAEIGYYDLYGWVTRKFNVGLQIPYFGGMRVFQNPWYSIPVET